MLKMKNSNVKWIGMIPEEWRTNKIKYEYKLQIGFTPNTTREDYYSDNGYTWISISDITSSKNKEIYKSSSKISQKFINEKHPLLVQKGSLLYSFKLSVGKVAFAGKDLYTNEAIASFKNENTNCLGYLYYASFLIEMNANINIYNAKILNQELINNAIVTVPNIKEQRLIADFLDDKIKKIDDILKDLNNQIEILDKYKKSFINEKMIYGFSSNIKEPNTNNIPMGWKKGRIKDVLQVLTDYTANGSFQNLADNIEYLDYESYARLVRLTDLRENLQNVGIYVSEKSYKYLKKSCLYGEEVLVANVGAYAGLFCMMPKINIHATLGPNMYLLKTNDLMLNKYLYYLGNAKYVNEQLLMKAQSSAQPKLNKEDVKTIKILIPPIEEQQQAIEYLDKKCEQIDSIIKGKKEQIEKMEKYKKSLIYEYITGKKRVKGAEKLYE